MVKVSSSIYFEEFNQLYSCLLKTSTIKKCSHLKDLDDGFISQVIFKETTTVTLSVIVRKRAYPSIIEQIVSNQTNHIVVMAPYISKESLNKCEQLGFSCVDMSGNCRVMINSLYISIEGKPNKFIRRQKSKTIFDPSSTISSLILREIMRDIKVQWKLSSLAMKLKCSIGQVFKIKDYLCEQLWAEMQPN